MDTGEIYKYLDFLKKFTITSELSKKLELKL